jgi:hypothetical protein
MRPKLTFYQRSEQLRATYDRSISLLISEGRFAVLNFYSTFVNEKDRRYLHVRSAEGDPSVRHLDILKFILVENVPTATSEG